MPLVHLSRARIESIIADLENQIAESKLNIAHEILMCCGVLAEIEQVERDYRPGIEKLEQELARLKASLLPESTSMAMLAEYNSRKLAFEEQRCAVDKIIKPIAMHVVELRWPGKDSRTTLWAAYSYNGFELCPTEGITVSFKGIGFEGSFQECFPISYLDMSETEIVTAETFTAR